MVNLAVFFWQIIPQFWIGFYPSLLRAGKIEKSGNTPSLSVIITALIWCGSICIQGVIFKTKFDENMFYELAASFIFSMGVGQVLMRTGFIGFTMVGHFMERIVSTKIRKSRFAKV